jgi:succinate dehydrogenase / fumarate reductase cytochrome b subunit
MLWVVAGVFIAALVGSLGVIGMHMVERFL